MSGLKSVANWFTGGQSIRQQINAQKELARYQFDLNREQWAAENDYNSPLAQVTRLKSAGLNPNLVYGSGSVAGNTTTQGPRASIPHVERNQLKFENLADIAARTESLKFQRNQNILLEEEVNKRKEEVEHIRLENQRLRGFYDYDLEDKRLGIERLRSSIENIQANTALTNQQKSTEIYKLVEMRSRVKLNEQQRRNAEATYGLILEQKGLTKQQKENAIAMYSSIIANTNLTLEQIKNATATYGKILADTRLSGQSLENMLASYTNIVLRNDSFNIANERNRALNEYYYNKGRIPGSNPVEDVYNSARWGLHNLWNTFRENYNF